jgi:hypothetical protein
MMELDETERISRTRHGLFKVPSPLLQEDRETIGSQVEIRTMYSPYTIRKESMEDVNEIL